MNFRLPLSVLFLASCGAASAQAHKPAPHAVAPTGPTAVIDTTAGRLACRLFSKEAPETTQRFIDLATGAKDWTDPVTGTPMHGKPFYDGTALYGVTDGIGGGDRTGLQQGTAGPSTPTEKTLLKPDRAGLLGMKVTKGETSSSLFVIIEHADLEYARTMAVIGLCDEDSIQRVQTISHTLLAAGNHPEKEIGISHVAIVPAGTALPPPAPEIAESAIVPRFGAEPAAAFPSPEPTGPTAVIATTLGTMTCKLFKETPVSTANFIGLAKGTKEWAMPSTKVKQHGRPFFDGLHFNRVIPDFMVEQGDLPGDGSGDGSIGYQFNNEIVPGLTFDRPGRLAYANSGPTTNQSEWFVTEHAQHRLDGNYTIFGQCDDAAVKVVEAIARVPRDAHNEPLKPVSIKTVTIRP
ncbi:peptidyl-prolyl cis-trans isomerase A (cyclophilin A) [Granulicella pectinivorans]|uniref:peptidylprolyl isomerase n=1 Tax=Granulicella pectinivorans TaxID=474950 RepID=A0A1I6LEU0_9BACT|nr:peptidylprolyl isomerase [Granulicella pectinivorans]SFS01981.1 peptidyl-prolyl cis-trans isomerase A (cyclophilin A) [Granulicella pectinivorans]